MGDTDKKDAEMREDIQRYLKIKDYYEVLGIEKDADDSKIKNAYRRLAIRFHPDKNKCEGAKQVFHKISNSYTTLIDKHSRETYDRYGPNDELLQKEAARRHQEQHYPEGQEFDEFEYVFRQFFGGAAPRGNTYYYQFGGRNNNGGLQVGGFNMMHLFIIVTLAMSFLPRLFESQPYHSLKRGGDFTQRRVTPLMKTEYFARTELSTYAQGRPDRLQQVEQQVDADFYRLKRQECETQTYNRKRLQQAAYASWSEERRAQYLQAAAEVDMASCEKVRTLQDYYYDYLSSIL